MSIVSATRTRLDLEGMHCGSCASAIERRLNELDGVEATVNLATAQATVSCDEPVPVDELVAAVESIGYGARPARSAFDGDDHAHHHEAGTTLRAQLLVAVVLTLPVALLSMVPSLRFAGWEWVALVLSTPVVFYAGAGFHRAALRSARHGAATMDTLISLGTLAAFTWSVVVLVFGLDTDT